MNFFKVIFCCIVLPGIVNAASVTIEACNGRNGTPLSCGVGEGYNEDTGRCETCVDKNSGTNRYVSHKIYFDKSNKTTLYEPGENTNICSYRTCQFVCRDDSARPSNAPRGCADNTGRPNYKGWNITTKTCDQCAAATATQLIFFNKGKDNESSCLYYVCAAACETGKYYDKTLDKCKSCLSGHVNNNQTACIETCPTGEVPVQNQCTICPAGTSYVA